MSQRIEDARAFALAAHGEQKYGPHPYARHLDDVAAIAGPHGEDAIVAAYLHDTVEDTAVRIEEVEARFGAFIAECVALLTDEPGGTRPERKARTHDKLAEVSGELELALVVKASDRLANVRACVADGRRDLLDVYRGEHPVFRDAAWRPGLCDALWAELDALLAGE